MAKVKLSVSLSASDLETLDRFVAAADLRTRSAGIQAAIQRLDDSQLREAYAAAFDEWRSAPEAASWEASVHDGLADASR